MKNYQRILLALLVLSLSVPSLGWAGRRQQDSYKSVLSDWTRDAEAYNWKDGLEARMVWHATYLSRDFRHAKVERYAKLYQLQSADIERLKLEENSEAEKYDSFIVAIYAGSRVFPDLGKDRSLWRLVMETSEGTLVEPEKWEDIPKNQVTRTLFPYIDRWSKLYEVKFPKRITSLTQKAQLKMIGVPADSTLDWDLSSLRRPYSSALR